MKISFDPRMKEAKKSLASKIEVNNAVDLEDKNWKKTPENIQAFNLSYLLGNSHFEDDGKQNYLVFKPVLEYFKTLLINNNYSMDI